MDIVFHKLFWKMIRPPSFVNWNGPWHETLRVIGILECVQLCPRYI